MKNGKVYKLVPIAGTTMESKENKILELFFNNQTKEWHFEEIVKTAKLARSKAHVWLKKFVHQGLIKRIKEKGKMPHYVANYESADYQNKKKLFALNQLYEAGFLNHLVSLPKAKTIIVFGSFVRWDWYKNSDIDLFIYGDEAGLSLSKYESNLHRNIQLFICHDKKELKKLGNPLIQNIITGNLVKGDLNFLKVSANA